MLDYQYMHHVEMNSATIINIMAISIMISTIVSLLD